jgi:hypothetical protein
VQLRRGRAAMATIQLGPLKGTPQPRGTQNPSDAGTLRSSILRSTPTLSLLIQTPSVTSFEPSLSTSAAHKPSRPAHKHTTNDVEPWGPESQQLLAG